MNLAEYAAHRGQQGLSGTTKAAVLQAITGGRLTTRSAKKVRGRWRIDPDEADREWEANTNHNLVRDLPTTEQQQRRAVQQRRSRPKAPELPPGVPAMVTSKAIREAYQAKLAAIEYEERSGKLVDGQRVRTVLFGQLRSARDAILGVEPKVVDELAAIAGGLDADQRRRVQALLQRELRAVCQQLAGVTIEGVRDGAVG